MSNRSTFLDQFASTSRLIYIALLTGGRKMSLAGLKHHVTTTFSDSGVNAKTGSGLLCACRDRFDIPRAVAHVRRALRAVNIPIFTGFSRKGGTRRIKLRLHPGRIVIFNSPGINAGLVRSGPDVSVRLPLGVSI